MKKYMIDLRIPGEPINIEMESELLPCPFCGSKDLFAGWQSAQSLGIQCRKCRVEMERCPPARYPKGCNSLEDLVVWTMCQAIAAWNKRKS